MFSLFVVIEARFKETTHFDSENNGDWRGQHLLASYSQAKSASSNQWDKLCCFLSEFLTFLGFNCLKERRRLPIEHSYKHWVTEWETEKRDPCDVSSSSLLKVHVMNPKSLYMLMNAVFLAKKTRKMSHSVDDEKFFTECDLILDDGTCFVESFLEICSFLPFCMFESTERRKKGYGNKCSKKYFPSSQMSIVFRLRSISMYFANFF